MRGPLYISEYSDKAIRRAKRATHLGREVDWSERLPVVWRALAERCRSAVYESRLLLVEGTVQREGEVLHIPSRVAHQAEALDDTLSLDVYCPGRDEWRPADAVALAVASHGD